MTVGTLKKMPQTPPPPLREEPPLGSRQREEEKNLFGYRSKRMQQPPHRGQFKELIAAEKKDRGMPYLVEPEPEGEDEDGGKGGSPATHFCRAARSFEAAIVADATFLHAYIDLGQLLEERCDAAARVAGLQRRRGGR